MNDKYSKEQIKRSICKWSRYLLENNLLNKDEAEELLGEGLFKRSKTFVKNAFKHVGQGIANGIKAAKLKIHDTFKANDGVKQLMDAIKSLWKEKKVDASKIKFYIFDSKATYPVAKFVLSKNKKALAALYSKNIKIPCSLVDLVKLLSDAKVVGNDKKITDFIEALVIGKLEDSEKVVSEMENLDEDDKLSRLDAVIDALGWKENTATRSENARKMMMLLGTKDINAVKERIKAHFSEKNLGDDEEKEDKSSKNSKEDSYDSETFDKDEENSKEEKQEKSKKQQDKEKLEEFGNDYLIVTTDGKEVGVMDNPFKNVQVKGTNIGIRFNLSSKDQRAKDDLESALG